MAFPSKRHQFKAGQSGNPGGSSRRQRITAHLTSLIDEGNGERALAAVWFQSALAGDFKFFRELLNRIDGPVEPPQPPQQFDPAECVADAEKIATARRRQRKGDKAP